jgi:hypothetical protein
MKFATQGKPNGRYGVEQHGNRGSSRMVFLADTREECESWIDGELAGLHPSNDRAEWRERYTIHDLHPSPKVS